jgi:nitrate/nitrite transport system permease protein
MIFQSNLVAPEWLRTKLVVLSDRFLLPCAGFLGVVLLWWLIPIANLDCILNPFFQRGPTELC